MTSIRQLQTKIEELETELQSFKQQLNTYKVPTLAEASVGDTLKDGSIVLQKSNGLALLVAPKSTEVSASWSKEFSDVFAKLKEQGFNLSQWFVPTEEQLLLAYQLIPQEFSSSFSSACYWSSTEDSATDACFVGFCFGNTGSNSKACQDCVRAFRCVTY
jgi:hypothetical protein